MKKATLFVTLAGSAMFVAAGCSEPASTTPATTPGGPTGPSGMKSPGMPGSETTPNLGAPSAPESGSATKPGADAAAPADKPADAALPAEKPTDAAAPAEAPK
jgi:preprotein translocase subunit SecD